MITEKQCLMIKKKLLEQHKTITDLAKELEVERTFLSGIINGKRNSKSIESILKQKYISKRGE